MIAEQKPGMIFHCPVFFMCLQPNKKRVQPASPQLHPGPVD
jgi:hypothetical protein